PTSDTGTTIVVKSPPMAVNSPTGTQTVNVKVVTAGGTSTVIAADEFTYFAVPAVNSVSPNSGPLAGGTPITISGSNFAGPTAVYFGTTAATNVTVVSSTEVTATIPKGKAGTVNVTVTTLGGTSATSSADKYTYTSTAAPTITSVTAATSPAAGPLAGGTQVTITGTNLATARTAKVYFGGVTATVVSDNGTQIVVKSPQRGDDTGTGVDTVNVTVATGGATASAVDAFTYFDVPTVDEVDPARGAGGDAVTITGYAFGAPLTVYFGQAPATNVAVVPGTGNSQITATAPPGTGTVDVTVRTPGGTSAVNPFSPSDEFTYLAIPTVTSVSPSSGPLPGGTQVTITGTNLGTLDTVTVLFGGIAAGLYSDDGTTIVLLSPAGAAAGPVDVTVSTQDGTSAINLNDEFTYLAIPTVTSVSPSSGPLSGGTQVTITGTNLGTLDRAVVLFGGISAGLPYSDDGTTIVLLSPAGAAAGPVDVTVSDYYGTSATTPADQFTYTASAPGAARVNSRIAAHNASDLALLALTGQPSPSATIQREMVDNLMALLVT
ncbi:MAG: IPT/TIG domain-containing protein, partial [Thermoguttaceae bacterium]